MRKENAKRLIENRLDYARIRQCVIGAKIFKSIKSFEAEKLLKLNNYAKRVKVWNAFLDFFSLTYCK